VLCQVIRRNRIVDGMVYLQVTRGAARRDHAFPNPGVIPTLVITARAVDYTASSAKAAKGVQVHTLPENRWGRCDIKTVALLPNALAKQAAVEAGAYEAWFVDDAGLVTEGSSTNAWIVDGGGTVRTRGAEANILRGVTRTSLMDIVRDAGFSVSETPFSVAEAQGAREAFVSSASAMIMPVVGIDGTPVGDGRPGPVTTRLRELYLAHAKASAIWPATRLATAHIPND
jgi:D-alanine transaminase